MKLYHATRASRNVSASKNAEAIVRGGFNPAWNYNRQADGVSFSSRPLTGWGGWEDAWVVIEVVEEEAEEYRYTDDDDLYRCQCYFIPEKTVNTFSRRAICGRREVEWEEEEGEEEE